MAKTKRITPRILDARPDTLDFRDKMYVPTLCEVPTFIDLKQYRKMAVPILDQGKEGACTGFGLATVANYLLRKRKITSDPKPVSARMIYEMARRYDEWPGEKYTGSSARGAMKGWHKHGICGEECWPYKVNDKDNFRLTEDRTSDALKRPLGAYFRVNHKDLIAMHTAIAEVGILYATANVHEGWNEIGSDGVIPYTEKQLGGHAFAIVGYEDRGFWIQNSWGADWGLKGFALITYDDWMSNGTDIWVARLGAPVRLYKASSTSIAQSAGAGESEAYSFSDLRPHIVSIGNDGQLKPGGNYGTTEEELASIFREDFKRVTANWTTKRILLYAHGGLVSEKAAVQRLADYRPALLQSEVYPISFIWHSDYWSTTTNILKDALKQRRPEGFLDDTKDFMLDRLDDALEPLARVATGKLQWNEMKENAMLATVSEKGGARLVLEELSLLKKALGDKLEIHMAGHSAGSIFNAPFINLLTAKDKIKSGPLKGQQGYNLTIESCTLWAPACTIELFKEMYLPAIKENSISRFALFVLSDKAEKDDNCGHVYNKSLLYLVSNAFEKTARIPFLRDGVPILGMQKFLDKDSVLKSLFNNGKIDLVVAPNLDSTSTANYSTASSHGSFDDDTATVTATLARILDHKKTSAEFTFTNSASSMKSRRENLSEKS